MADSIYVGIGPELVAQLEQVRVKLGEATASDVVSRALGLLIQITPFIDEQGNLSVQDPAVGDLVEFQFPGIERVRQHGDGGRRPQVPDRMM